MESQAQTTIQQGPVPADVLLEIERFYTREARLLDEERFPEWLELLTEDIHYWMPIRENRYRKDPKAKQAPPTAIYDDNMMVLQTRIARLATGLVWVEDPPNRMRRLITNVDAEWADVAGEVNAYSNFLVHRSRRERDEAHFIGTRQDRLRKVGNSWKIAKRKILLDHHVVLDKNLYFLI